MKICKHCNSEVEDTKEICPKCGAMVDNYIDNDKYQKIYNRNNKGKFLFNKRLIGWFLLGFILPGISFIIYFLLRDSGERDRARAILYGGIISFVLVSIINIIIGFLPFNEGNEKEQAMFNLFKNLI